MRLLVSIRDAAEARIALGAGSDIVDAKEPSRGVLGPVDAAELQAIAAVTSGRRPLSAALGDVGDLPPSTKNAVCAAVRAGVAIAKLGVHSDWPRKRRLADCRHVAQALGSYAAAGQSCELVLAAYAEESVGTHTGAQTGSHHAREVIELAHECGAAGVLLDTVGKVGRSLFNVIDARVVAAWVVAAHEAGLFAAVAGSLGKDHVPIARDCGADIIGVRGAACEGGRNGSISAARVADLVEAVAG